MTFVKNSSRLCNTFRTDDRNKTSKEEEEENLINLSFFQEREKRDLVFLRFILIRYYSREENVY